MKKVITAIIENGDIRTEDGGMAKIASIFPEKLDTLNEYMFVRIHSWHESETPKHPEFNALMKPGKRITITIEVED